MRRVIVPQHFFDHPLPVAGAIREFHGFSMGTTWSVRVVEAGATLTNGVNLQQSLQSELDLIVQQMSHWLPDSDLGRFNRAPANSWRSLPAPFFDVLAFALDVASECSGAYDPCAGAIVERWGFGAEQRHDEAGFQPPSSAEIAALLAGRTGVLLDHTNRRACQSGDVRLDLSSVAKGYAVDRLSRYLEAQGLRHHLVEVGGELRGAGTKPDGQPWWVALEQGDQVMIALHGLSIATSGDYRRYFEQDGQHFSHTIDPRTAEPIINRVGSVTVLHADCMAADAWSTALTVLGPQAGLLLAERRGLAVRFLVRAGGCGQKESMSEHISSHWRSMEEA
jgi:thiamine biosynthesis lipoprotein